MAFELGMVNEVLTMCLCLFGMCIIMHVMLMFGNSIVMVCYVEFYTFISI